MNTLLLIAMIGHEMTDGKSLGCAMRDASYRYDEVVRELRDVNKMVAVSMLGDPSVVAEVTIKGIVRHCYGVDSTEYNREVAKVEQAKIRLTQEYDERKSKHK